ncbi:DJ-1/PfpI family protein [soil metagenome]|jgi:putative intracellular protease/amidase
MKVSVLMFDNFETLDVFGPVELFARIKDHYQVLFYSLSGGLIKNDHGVSIMTEKLSMIEKKADIFLIPGGYGTRIEVNNLLLINEIRRISQLSRYVLTVCTGTSLLAKTGLLDAKYATTNKRAYDWVLAQGPNVKWIKKARWVVDDKYYTSSGVSAGMDMTLGFISDLQGLEFARELAYTVEYNWVEDKDEDNFVEEYKIISSSLKGPEALLI